MLPFPELPTLRDGHYALRDDELLFVLLCMLNDDEFTAAAQKHEPREAAPRIDMDSIAGRMERDWRERRSREIAAQAAAAKEEPGA